MGLDMYLEKRHYVKNWDHMAPAQRHRITVEHEDGSPSPIQPKRICGITEDVAYWRKANAIHLWFVKNVQGGKDDCGEYRVERAQLQTLKEVCDRVLGLSKLKPGKVNNGFVIDKDGHHPIVEDGEVVADPQLAETLLPTKGGFFFGSTDYDEGYIEDLQYTSKTLGELLAEPDSRADYYYRASW